MNNGIPVISEILGIIIAACLAIKQLTLTALHCLDKNAECSLSHDAC